jgi:biotin carboxyl carrier protein
VADLEPLGNGWFAVRDGDRRWRIALAVDGDTRWVFLDGRVAHISAAERAEGGEPAEAARRVPTGETARVDSQITAPMPATVVTIHATPGQRVEPGDVVVVLEAMKMELPVHTPRGGVVSAVHCAPGDLVQPGVVLLEVE